MANPDARFLRAMTQGKGFGGINFQYLESCTYGFLINQVLAVKAATGSDMVLKKHRAMALQAELQSRPEFKRPQRTRESEALNWLDEQIMRRRGV